MKKADTKHTAGEVCDKNFSYDIISEHSTIIWRWWWCI